MEWYILMCVMTTEGPSHVESDAAGSWYGAAAQLEGLIAAVGEDNVIYALVRTR